MWRAVIASINAHRLRLVATSMSIVVGIAFVSGTLILSDTLRQTFDNLFTETTAGIDVVVQGPGDSADAFTGQLSPVPVDVARQVEAVEGVQTVAPEVQGLAQLVDADGQPLGGAGPPTLAFNAPVSDAITTPSVREGRFPTAADEVAVDGAALESLQAEIGDSIGVALEGPVQDFTVVGVVGFGDLENLAGATLVVLEPEFAFETFGQDGFDLLSVIAEEGVDPADLRDAVAAAVGSDLDVLTRLEAADQASAQVSAGLGFFTTALLAFAGVALFVGAFLIANTFNIIVAQRTRELALLRAVGASRRQVLTSVLGEALVTGLVGSAGGFVAGLLIARGLYALLDLFGIALPTGDLVVSSRTFLICMVLGTVLTVVMAVLPAVRSTRVLPVAALQAVAAPPMKSGGVLRYALGGLVFLGGIVGLTVSLLQETGLAAVGAAAAVTLIGAAFLAPLITRPLISMLGGPLRAGRGVPGDLATQNALRNPQRTASTASALMIGLALVSFVAILASSFSASIEQTIEDSFTGDFVVTGGGFGIGVDPGPQLIEDLSAVDGVELTVVENIGVLDVDGVEDLSYSTAAGEYEQVVTLDIVDGGVDGLVTGGVALDDQQAAEEGYAVGDVVTVIAPSGETGDIEIVTVYAAGGTDSGWLFDQGVLAAAGFPDDTFRFANSYIELAEGADAGVIKQQLDVLVAADYPSLQVQDLTGLQEQISGQVNQLLGLITALLALSIIVALFGIVNTLGLSVFERVRELGLLRAVGATRSQVRAMIRWESVLIALLGAVFGLTIGVLFAWLVVTALGDEAPLTLSIPAVQVLAGLLIAALAGVLASVIPARRAGRTDILRALQAS